MRQILISINPEYVKKIFDGEKKYEYRKSIAKKNISWIVRYETKPKMKVVGKVKIEKIVKETPEKLWKITKHYSGVVKNFFDLYFKGKKIAYAYKLGKVLEYKKPKTLHDFGVKNAPQSFVYITKRLKNKNLDLLEL